MKFHKAVFFVLFFCVALTIANFNFPASAQRKNPPARTRPYTRYTTLLKDQNGSVYRVSIKSAHEKIETIDDAGGDYNEGSKSASGVYFVTISKRHSGISRKEQIPLFGAYNKAEATGEFNLARKYFYIIKGRKHEPDLLLVTQYQSSNTSSGRVFFIQRGQLVPVVFKYSPRGSEINRSLSWWPFKRLKPLVYRTGYYFPGTGSNWQMWRFKPEKRAFVLIKTGRNY